MNTASWFIRNTQPKKPCALSLKGQSTCSQRENIIENNKDNYEKKLPHSSALLTMSGFSIILQVSLRSLRKPLCFWSVVYLEHSILGLGLFCCPLPYCYCWPQSELRQAWFGAEPPPRNALLPAKQPPLMGREHWRQNMAPDLNLGHNNVIQKKAPDC